MFHLFRPLTRFTRLFLMVGVLVLGAAPAPVFAYEHEGHYAWTYYLALHVGYTKRQAFQIASGAYALDEDPDTGPMEATPGDAILGAERGVPLLPPGSGLTFLPVPQQHLKIARIWREFHAFERSGATAAEAGKARTQREKELWDLARKQLNPGVLLHYVQDSFPHHGWDDVRGHAAAGHRPDFLSGDPAAAHNMTLRTVSILSEFMRTALGKEPKPISAASHQRFSQVLEQLMRVNPVPTGGENYIPAGDTGRPDLGRAVQVINQAVHDDEIAGRLPRFLGGDWDPTFLGNRELPVHWHQFDYDETGMVLDKAFRLEQLVLKPGTPSILPPGPPTDGGRVRVRVRVPYRLSGLTNPALSSFPLQVPVFERKNMPGAEPPLVEGTRLRPEGEHVLEAEGDLDRGALESGKLEWTFLIHVWGLESVTIKVLLVQKVAQSTGKFKLPGTMRATNPADAKRFEDSFKPRAGQGTAAGGEPGERAPAAAPPRVTNPDPALAPWAGSTYDDGREAFVKREWGGAEAAIRSAIRSQPYHARYHHSLAVVIIAQGRAGDAEQPAREAVRLDRNDSRNRQVLGSALALQNKWLEAEKEYREAVRLAPQDGQLHAALAVVLLKQGSRDRAVEAARSALRFGYRDDALCATLGVTP